MLALLDWVVLSSLGMPDGFPWRIWSRSLGSLDFLSNLVTDGPPGPRVRGLIDTESI